MLENMGKNTGEEPTSWQSRKTQIFSSECAYGEDRIVSESDFNRATVRESKFSGRATVRDIDFIKQTPEKKERKTVLDVLRSIETEPILISVNDDNPSSEVREFSRGDKIKVNGKIYLIQ